MRATLAMKASQISARASGVADLGNLGVKYSNEKMTWLSSELVDSLILLMRCMISGVSVLVERVGLRNE